MRLLRSIIQKMVDIKDKEKLQILVDNKAKLSYRELTNYLEIPYLGGWAFYFFYFSLIIVHPACL